LWGKRGGFRPEELLKGMIENGLLLVILKGIIIDYVWVV